MASEPLCPESYCTGCLNILSQPIRQTFSFVLVPDWRRSGPPGEGGRSGRRRRRKRRKRSRKMRMAPENKICPEPELSPLKIVNQSAFVKKLRQNETKEHKSYYFGFLHRLKGLLFC